MVFGCLAGSPDAFALDPPHDTSNLPQVCDTCHISHNSYGTILNPSVGDTIENLCKSCHFTGGPGRAAETHACTPGPDCDFSFSMTCTRCHDPHTQWQNVVYGSTYGKFLRDVITTPSSGDRTVILLGPEGPKSFADGDSTIDGVCEVCHTQTHYHRNDGSYPSQHLLSEVTYCTNCHDHANGFIAQGECTACHDQNSGMSGKHDKHVRGENIPCSRCHNCVVDSGNNLIFNGNHANGTIDVCGSNLNYNPSNHSCNPSCHGSKTWTNKPYSICNLCHDDGSQRNSNRLSGKHYKHLNEGISCSECHPLVVDSSMNIIDKGLHRNGVK
ncbi:MAG: hypothetical protein D6806_04925, partial [Deltaproteobacteria bacterium]